MTIKQLANNQIVVYNGTYNFFSYEQLIIQVILAKEPDYFYNILAVYDGFNFSVTTNKWTNKFLEELNLLFTVDDIKKAISSKNDVFEKKFNFTIMDYRKAKMD